MTNESKLCGYIFYSDGKIDRDCSGAGMLYNIHYGQVEDIFCTHACCYYCALDLVDLGITHF
jgi:hypothetical protein